MIPTKITLHQLKRELELQYADGQSFRLPCLLLRQKSPSADHRLTPKPISDKVNITAIEPVGQYAVKLQFDDGHSSGLYSWELLQQLTLLVS